MNFAERQQQTSDADLWADWCLAGNTVVNIGQLSKATVRNLNSLVAKGQLVRFKSHYRFPQPKTCWHKADAPVHHSYA